jgi:hypothetical protein
MKFEREGAWNWQSGLSVMSDDSVVVENAISDFV